MSGDLYTILGVDRSASADDIRRAYLRIVRVIHPDRFDPTAHKADWDQANQMMASVNHAYRILSDAALRREYDVSHGFSSSPPRSAEKRAGDHQGRSSSKQQPPSFSRSHRGKTHFDALPTELQERLLGRQARAGVDPLTVRISDMRWSIFGIATSLLLAVAIVWLATASPFGPRAWVVLLFGLVPWVIVASLSWYLAARWVRARLKSYVYITPLYVIHTKLDRIAWWPLWDLTDVRVSSRVSNGEPRGCDITLELRENEQISLSFKETGRGLKWLDALGTYQKRAAKALQGWDESFLKREGMFARVPNSERSASQLRRTWYTSLTVNSTLAMGLLLTTVAVNPGVEADRSRAATLGSGDSHSATSFHGIARTLPISGTQQNFSSRSPLAPLEIRTRGAGTHYFVKLEDVNTDQTVITLFVRGGESAEIEVPLGAYRMKYATGTTWYGTVDLFGPQTGYHQAESTFRFYDAGESYSGYTVELYRQSGGNLRTSRIRPDAW
jgi:hypothetical protein